MVDGAVEHAILAVSIIAALLGVSILASGEIAALGVLAIGVVGFAYLERDSEWLEARTDSREYSNEDPGEEALATLRRRYARGDIEKAEFERKLDDLLETETIDRAERYREVETVREGR